MDHANSAMSVDELSAPLGQRARRRHTVPRAVPIALAGTLGLMLCVFGIWIAVVDDPLGGEPVVVISTRADVPKNSPADNPPAQSHKAPSGNADAPQSGTQIVTIIDGSSGARQQVVIPSPSRDDGRPAERQSSTAQSGRTTTAEPGAKLGGGQGTRSKPRMLDERLVEKSRHGLLPQIAADGSRPASIYAHPDAATMAAATGPKVALVVGKLGIGAQATALALDKLPPTVTLAFNPHAGDLAQWVGRARSDGREILLQIPMEPFDYPDNDPGPRTLLTSLPLDQNIDRLHWSMTRTTGYVGLSNYMGARLAGNDAAMTAIMLEARKRGLLYFEDGTIRSSTEKLPASRGVPFARADIVVDAPPTAADIDAALERLETVARQRGSAIGFATAAPLSIERIARWAGELHSRGISLVPITAIIGRAPSS